MLSQVLDIPVVEQKKKLDLSLSLSLSHLLFSFESSCARIADMQVVVKM